MTAAMNLTPEQHLDEACRMLDAIKAYPSLHGMAGIADAATPLSAIATAHLTAAQVKMKMDENPYVDPRPWNEGKS